MEREIVGKRPHYRPNRHKSSFYRVMLYLSLIIAGIWLLLGYQRGELKSPFDATPTPTRVAESYFSEARAYFEAGKLDDPSNQAAQATPQNMPRINDAIEAYQAALAGDPNNADAWAQLARIQVYSTNLLRNDTEREARLREALESATRATTLQPDNSTYHAIRAFALDWYSSNSIVPREQREQMLVEAEFEASRAFQLDPQNPLALAFYAEILADQQKWLQGEKYASQAVQLGKDLMDTHRVYGYVLETLAQYNLAIQQYQEAAEIAPNLTFLYIRIGVNYREGIKNANRALEYFERAARIDEQLGVSNPLPYIEIARTYTQEGQFFAASVNAVKALELDKTNATTYGQLGMIYRRARNYEGATSLLQCAVTGCKAEENELGKVAVEGLPLTSITVAYYYVEYGTNLAFLSRPGQNMCPTARVVLEQVRQAYPKDPDLMGIVEDSEGLCRRVEGGGAAAMTPTPQASSTPTP